MPGERKRSVVVEKKVEEEEDDDIIPIVVNSSASKSSKLNRNSPAAAATATTPKQNGANLVPQRKAAASAEKTFKPSKKKKKKGDSSSEGEENDDKDDGKDEKKAKDDSSSEEEDDDSDSDSESDSKSPSKSPSKKGSATPKTPKVMIDPKTGEAVESIKCTACDKQTPVIKHRVKRHATLNCLVCRRCHQFYYDGEFERDEDGTEVHCQWCAEGGNVLMCDDCPHVFCKSCLKRNLGRDKMKEVESADNWKCLVCNPKPIEPLTRECNRIMKKFEGTPTEKVSLKLDRVSSAITDLDSGVQQWAKLLKNIRGDFKDLEKKKKKKKPEEHQKKMIKVGKDVAKVVKHIKSIVTKVESELTVAAPSKSSAVNGDGSEFITIEEIVDGDKPVDISITKSPASSKTKTTVEVEVSDISSNSSDDDDDDSSSSESDSNRRKSGYEKDPAFSSKVQSKKKNKADKEEEEDDEEEEEEEGGEGDEKETKEKKASVPRGGGKKKKGRPGREKKPEPTAMKMKKKKPGEKKEEEKEEEEEEDDEEEKLPENEKAKRDLLKMMKDSSDSDADDEEDDDDEGEGGDEKKKKKKTKKREGGKGKEGEDESEEAMDVDSEDEGHDSELERDIKKWGKSEGKKKWAAKKKGKTEEGKTADAKEESNEADVKEEKDKEKDGKEEEKKEGKEEEKSDEKESKAKSKTPSSKKSKGKSPSEVDLFADGDTDYENDDDDDNRVTSTDDISKKDAKSAPSAASKADAKEDGKEEEKASLDANEAAKKDLKAMMEESEESDDEGGDDDDFKIEDKKKKKEGSKSEGKKKASEEKTTTQSKGKDDKKKKEETEEEGEKGEDEAEKSKTRTGKYRTGLLNAKITIEDSDEEKEKKKKAPSKEEDKDKKAETDKKKLPDGGKKKKSGGKEDPESDREEVLIESMDEEEEEKEDKTAAGKKKGGSGKDKGKKEEEKPSGNPSDSDSDFVSGPKKRNQRKRRRDDDSDVVNISDDDGDDSGKKKKKETKKKGRKRVKKGGDSSCEEDKISGGEDNDEESPRKRKRKIIKDSKLQEETKAALEAEEARRKRVKEKQKLYNVGAVGTEDDPSSPVKCPKVTSLVLDRNAKKEPVVQVEPSICEHLKPHQVEGVQFMYDCVVESVERVQKGDAGGGAILAHCMGLGKTLQVITLVHTILTHEKLLNFKKVLIICPVNVCLNWVDEFVKWVPEDSLDIYEMSSIKDNRRRAEYLEEWQEDGGIMILGYDMFRNLASGSNVRQKKLRETFEKCLINPGADLIVCDEGHLLKNEATAISKVMSTVKTKRRISLTGTPLQNNLIEYHCMVQFVKPNLLGTKKEFLNRFVNPILAGQGKDSSAFDVKLMKQRAHILHEMLDGCVQRRDYSALTKFLPPKHEYVIKVRLSPLQIKLYQEYLEQFVHKKDQPPEEKRKLGAGGRLFQDYQYLSRIWTHPQCLALAQRRADIRDQYKWIEESDADSDLMTSSSDNDDLKTSSSESDDSDIICEDSDKKGKKKDKKKKNEKRKSGKDDKKDDKKDGKKKKDDDESEDDEKKKKKAAKKDKKAAKKQQIDDDDKLIGDSGKAKSNGREASPEYTRTGRARRACTKKDDDEDDGRPPRSPTPPKEEVYWWTPFVKEACPVEGDLAKPILSGKMSMLINILRESESVGDKILVFSQSLASLDMIEEYLSYENELAKEGKLTDKTASAIWGWNVNDDYFRMDGGTNCDIRQKQMALFNDTENNQARLFLISTKAGSLGVNLVAANRVVVFDASWNPSYDVQSIFRVYRYGQTKPVYIYRLIAQATMEEKIYDRQVNKQSLAQRVIDEHQIDRHFNMGELQELYRFEPDRLDDPNRKEPPTPVLPKDRLLADMLKNMADQIYHYHEHDSLLENKEEQQLTEEERKAAWDEFEREKSTGYRSGPMPNFQQQQFSNANQAAGGPVPINFNGPINQYLMYISQMDRSQRMTAEMALMKMIYSANPHLTAGQEGVVYQRMQAIISQYEISHRREQQRQQQQQQRMRQAQEQEARINAHLYNQLGGKASKLHSPYAQQAYAAQAAQAAQAAHAASFGRGRPANAPHAPAASTSGSNLSNWEQLRAAIIRQIDAKDHGLAMLIPFVYANYPPKDKRRFGEEEMAKFKSLIIDKRPEAKKKVKHLLLKVIQDYHPDKVADDHGEQWKLVSEEISKRLNKYFGELK